MKRLNSKLIIFLISTSIFALVLGTVYLNKGTNTAPNWVIYLPKSNAFFNFLTSIFLIIAFFKIKKKDKDIAGHKKYIFFALGSSFLFLIGYLLYHHFHGETKFLPLGWIRYTYFSLLISHILLTIFQVPLILFTLFHAFKNNFTIHKKLARWTFPIWLYVSVTGVIIFLFLNFLNN